jgi:hypothetical protein
MVAVPPLSPLFDPQAANVVASAAIANSATRYRLARRE